MERHRARSEDHGQLIQAKPPSGYEQQLNQRYLLSVGDDETSARRKMPFKFVEHLDGVAGEADATPAASSRVADWPLCGSAAQPTIMGCLR